MSSEGRRESERRRRESREVRGERGRGSEAGMSKGEEEERDVEGRE